MIPRLYIVDRYICWNIKYWKMSAKNVFLFVSKEMCQQFQEGLFSQTNTVVTMIYPSHIFLLLSMYTFSTGVISVDTFKSKLKTYLFSLAFNWILFIYLCIYLCILVCFTSWYILLCFFIFIFWIVFLLISYLLFLVLLTSIHLSFSILLFLSN